jgi:hypothetical protein
VDENQSEKLSSWSKQSKRPNRSVDFTVEAFDVLCERKTLSQLEIDAA